VEGTAAFLTIVLAGFVLWPKIDSAVWGADDVRLEIAEAVVSNPPAEYGGVVDGESIQDPKTEPTIAATVRNYGDDTAWIEEARIKVVAATRLNICFSQGAGDVPHSKRYRTTLPGFPGAEPHLYRRDLHVEVQPGHGVRPVLSFQKGDPTAANLYALDVEFVADPGDHVLDAGRFVIGVPGPVDRSGATLPESEQVLSRASEGPHTVGAWCFRHNLRGMRRVIAEPGRRSADVAALARLRPAPTWDAFVGDRPARQDVPALLGAEYPEAAIYAVEAAELDGDPEFAATVRDRATALLLGWGHEKLEDDAQEAMRDAERVLSLGPSSDAGRLLWRAKAARRDEEERAREELAELEAG
jgi:hypothetical protein